MKTPLDEFFESADLVTLERVNEWSIRRENEIVFLELPAKDQQVFRVRVECDRYPEQVPSVLFVDSAGSKLNPSAWPHGTHALMEIVKPPPNCFLCTELTREGLQHHPDWRGLQSAWNPKKHTLNDVFNLIHRLLHSDGYLGKGK